MRKRASYFLPLLALVALTPALGEHHVTVAPEALKWGGLPAAAIRGTPPADLGPLKAELAVVYGDPSKAGMFAVRLRLPDGARVAPHWHPQDEHVTVLKGLFAIGVGEKFDQASAKMLATGSYLMMPKRTFHYAWSKGETIVQVTGMGPFIVNFGPLAGAKKAAK